MVVSLAPISMFTAALMEAITYHGSLMPFLGIYVKYNAPLYVNFLQKKLETGPSNNLSYDQ